MAETTDLPPNEKEVAPTIPAAPLLAGAAEEAPKPYSSLSLLAIGGFVLGVGYAASLILAAVVALCVRTPLLLPLWTLAIPIGAALVCWAASVQIRNSEGALTGTRLTAWGLRLSLAVGALYVAYYSATYFAVTTQASSVAEAWLNLLKQGKVDEAFALTQPQGPSTAVVTKEDREKLRSRLELDYDRGKPGTGAFTAFRQSPLVRQFELGADADQWEFLGVQGWSYEGTAYQVRLTYRITTPTLISEALVTAVSIDNAEDGGRKWYLKEPQLTSWPRPTPEGERMKAMEGPARRFSEGWLAKLRNWDWNNAYLDTLPPAERKRQAEELKAEELKAEKRSDPITKALEAFRAGDLVRADPETFWAGAKEKDKVVEGMRGLFGHGENADDMSLALTMPMFWRTPDQVRFGFDLAIRIKALGILVQTRLNVAADAHGETLEPGDWRIESLDLISGKSLADALPKPAKPGAGNP